MVIPDGAKRAARLWLTVVLSLDVRRRCLSARVKEEEEEDGAGVAVGKVVVSE